MNATLNDILDQWDEDAKINIDLNVACMDTSVLHAKYLRHRTEATLRVMFLQNNHNIMVRDRRLHYQGRLGKETIDSYGWEYDPTNGVIPKTIADLQSYLDSDLIIQQSYEVIKQEQEIVDTIKQILESLRWRNKTIENVLQNRKFEAGVYGG